MRTGTNLGHNYSTCGLCKEVFLYRSDLCNKVVIKYALVIFGTYIAVFLHKWSLYSLNMVINQRFYPNLHVHQDLTVSI